MTKRLLQLSGVIVDLIYHVEQVPSPGEEAIVDGFQLSAGGGFNAMVAAQRAQMSTTYGGSLGQGPLADLVRTQLQSEQIAIIQTAQKDQDQGCCTVLVDASGERTFIASEGAEGNVTEEHLAAIDHSQFDWILISGYALVYQHSQVAIANWIAHLPSSSRVIFDPCPLVASIPQPLLGKVMNSCSWISCNQAEAKHLTGNNEPVAAANSLAKSLPSLDGVVVRQGESGCTVVAAGEDAVHIPGFRVSAIDTNGAGDAHVGTFIALLAGGADPKTACTIANAAAALSTTEKGPATTPRLEEVQAFISRSAGGNVIESAHSR